MKVLYSFIYLISISLIVFMSSCKTTDKTRSTAGTKTKTKKLSESTDKSILDNITKSTDLSGLVKDMSGSYISANEMAEDSTLYNVLLNTVPIWKTLDKKYLYVEQAIEGKEAVPLKQEVYQLQKDNDGGFEIKRYKLTVADAVAGKWKTPAFFDQYDTTILQEEVGCTLYVIQHADGSYSGSTRMDHCINTDEGAAYSTAILKVRDNQILSWEQGFDTNKVQVWGARKGGYRFIRKTTKS